jgi:hypothetical protein
MRMGANIGPGMGLLILHRLSHLVFTIPMLMINLFYRLREAKGNVRCHTGSVGPSF